VSELYIYQNARCNDTLKCFMMSQKFQFLFRSRSTCISI